MLQCFEGSLSSRPKFQHRLELSSPSSTPLLVPERSLQRPGKPISVQIRLRVKTHVKDLLTRTCWTSLVSTMMMMTTQLLVDLLLTEMRRHLRNTHQIQPNTYTSRSIRPFVFNKSQSVHVLLVCIGLQMFAIGWISN